MTYHNLDTADDANIPVNIWLYKEEEEEDIWRLKADNYMPRRNCVATDAYLAESKDRKELTDLIEIYILPLYKTACKKLEKMVTGEEDNLYYWEGE